MKHWRRGPIHRFVNRISFRRLTEISSSAHLSSSRRVDVTHKHRSEYSTRRPIRLADRRNVSPLIESASPNESCLWILTRKFGYYGRRGASKCIAAARPGLVRPRPFRPSGSRWSQYVVLIKLKGFWSAVGGCDVTTASRGIHPPAYWQFTQNQ